MNSSLAYFNEFLFIASFTHFCKYFCLNFVHIRQFIAENIHVFSLIILSPDEEKSFLGKFGAFIAHNNKSISALQHPFEEKMADLKF